MWNQAPDINWLPFLKVFFGLILLIVLAILAGLVALAHVEERTSFGLPFILGGLTSMSGGFVQWAFASVSKSEEKAA